MLFNTQVVTETITYKTVDGRNLTSDIYLPLEKKFEKSPVLYYFPGGGWSACGKGEPRQLLYSMQTLREQGVTIISSEYRVTTDGKTTFYELIEDCADAMRYFLHNADKYGIDPKCAGIAGTSAGGHISLVLGTYGNRFGSIYLDDTEIAPDFIIDVCGPTFMYEKGLVQYLDLFPDEDPNNNTITRLMGGTEEEVPQNYKDASPLYHVETCRKPPLTIVHGDHDQTVPLAQSYIYQNEYKRFGGECELTIVWGGRHNLSPDTSAGFTDVQPGLLDLDIKFTETFLENVNKVLEARK